MEIDKKYITLSKQEYEKQKKYIQCSFCEKIMIDPVQCKSCSNFFCLKCIKDLPNKKVTLFFSNLFTKKENICPHDKYEPSNDCINVINSLSFNCKNGCGLIIDIHSINNHLEYKCPRLGFKVKVNDINNNIQKLEKENETYKEHNKTLLNLYFLEVKKANPWIIENNRIKYKYHPHDLEVNANVERDWICDICHINHNRGCRSFCCLICDMDLCFECLASNLFC